jgi:hypothetical protein
MIMKKLFITATMLVAFGGSAFAASSWKIDTIENDLENTKDYILDGISNDFAVKCFGKTGSFAIVTIPSTSVSEGETTGRIRFGSEAPKDVDYEVRKTPTARNLIVLHPDRSDIETFATDVNSKVAYGVAGTNGTFDFSGAKPLLKQMLKGCHE